MNGYACVLVIKTPRETCAQLLPLLHTDCVPPKLNEHILNQCGTYSYDIICDQLNLKANLSKENRERYKEDDDQLRGKLPPSLIKAMTLAMEKGASSWLAVLPLAEHGFALHKSAFHDALAGKYVIPYLLAKYAK